MLDWLHGLPFVWLVVVVFGVTYLVAAAISWVVLRLAVGENARTFKAVSPGLLPPLGVVFGLLVGFLAVQVWNDHGEAQTAVNREASALRSVVLLGGSFPTAQQARMRVCHLPRWPRRSVWHLRSGLTPKAKKWRSGRWSSHSRPPLTHAGSACGGESSR